jgi:hypothetical protein
MAGANCPETATRSGLRSTCLTDAGDTVEPINAMPVFSALPVRIERAG